MKNKNISFRYWLLNQPHRSLRITDMAYEVQIDIDSHCMPDSCQSYDEIRSHIEQNHIHLSPWDAPGRAFLEAGNEYRRWIKTQWLAAPLGADRVQPAEVIIHVGE